MKKITLLFATLLAMYGMAFGQKEGKVLWENMVDTIATGSYVSSFTPLLSPSGNIFVQYHYVLNNNIRKSGIKLYDKNGKIVWNAIDFYNQASPTNFYANVQKDYTLVNFTNTYRSGPTTYDSTLYLGKNFNLLKKFEAPNSESLIPVDNGVFYYENGKKLVKYDSEGKAEWQYLSAYPAKVANKKAPYIATIVDDISTKQKIVILNNKGQKIGDTGNTIPLNGHTLLETNDKGFWYLPSNPASGIGYGKYDSTGKVTGGITPYASENTWWVQGKKVLSSHAVMADNSLFMSLTGNDGIVFVKIGVNGEMKRHSVTTQIKFSDDVNAKYKYKILEGQNKVMYTFPLKDVEQAEADIKYKIGVVDFDNLSASWSKEVLGGASNGIDGNAFTFEAGNIFFQAYSDPNQPLLKTFRAYNINGNLKWESTHGTGSPQGFPLNWKIIDDALYFSGVLTDSLNYGKYEMLKVRITDGKILWKKSSKPTFYKYNSTTTYVSNGSMSFCKISESIKKDKDGNDVIFYNEPSSTSFGDFKISVLNPDGTSKWIYTLLKSQEQNSQIGNNTVFIPTDDGKIIIFSQEPKDNKLQYILRKISPCTDINATATASNTEACPTEKIKLSIPKQDGLTYQWQKDGKDLPNLTDVVYDMSESGTYTVVVKDEACQNQATSNALKINIRSLPTAQIQAPKTTFCEGDKTTITATTNGVFFQWQKDGKDIPNATSGIYEASQAGEYRVGVRDDKCPQVGLSNIIPITLKPSPEAKITTDIKTVIYEPFTVKMTANTGTGLSYQWLKDDVIIPNETTNIYEAKKSGKYNVSVTKDGCQKTSEALNISIQIALAIESEINEETVQIYPNPSRGEFKLILPKTFQNAEIQLFDLLGRERTLIHTGEQARADGLVQGTYFLRVTKGEKSVTNKIVVE